MSERLELVPGRSCAGCTMCCKLLAVHELDKTPLAWCARCDAKAGCRAYAERPTECRDFYCGYLTDPALDERWKPSRSKLVVTHEGAFAQTLIHNDPARPGAWRSEPFHSQIRAWAKTAAAEGGEVIVWQGDVKIPVEAGPDE
ncbi:MAG TPA: hypothetical protein VJ740_15495 [Hyphomicrobiaceae bacterium]|jgi:hypothetical protein|nr:hypothetical protein [Hyphomicrobiaceae bacterium]